MYIVGLVIPVPEANMDAYRAWAASSAALFREYGCLEIVESRGDLVPVGKQTDFFRAVSAKPGETIVFSWQIWPDKETMLAVEAKMQTDPRFEMEGGPPFDASRLIYGCFTPLHIMGRA